MQIGSVSEAGGSYFVSSLGSRRNAEPMEALLVDTTGASSEARYLRELRELGVILKPCASGACAEELLATTRPLLALVIVDGSTVPSETIARLHRHHPSPPIVAVIAAQRAAERAVLRLWQQGLVLEWYPLPLSSIRLLYMLEHRRALRRTPAVVRPQDYLVGSCPQLERALVAIRHVACRSSAPVLITGESGTGKEAVARAIHAASDRACGPFVAVNCLALSSGLAVSDLFGHERGAFTGAVERKPGRIETAHRGTLLLDEIGDLPLDLQGHLLRFLQEQVIEHVGGTRSIAVDVRVLAATHVDIEALVQDGRFRADLYFRLKGLLVHMPPLRERGPDIELLARYYLGLLVRERGLPNLDFTPDGLEAIRRHAWPGNVRELRYAIERGVVGAVGPRIDAAALGLQAAAADTERPPTLREARRALDRQMAQDALLRTHHNIQRAAQRLDISRQALYRLLHRLGLDDRVDDGRGSKRIETRP